MGEDPQVWTAHLAELPTDPWNFYTDYPRETVDSSSDSTQTPSLSSVSLAIEEDIEDLSLLVAFCTTLGACDHGRQNIWVLDGSVKGGDPLPLCVDVRTGTLASLQERLSTHRSQLFASRRAAGVAGGVMALRKVAPPGRFAKQKAHPVCQAAFGREPPGDPRPDFILRVTTQKTSPCLDYRADLYDEATAHSLARHIMALTRLRNNWSSLKLDEAQRFMITDEERTIMLEKWKAQFTDLDGALYVHEMFQQHAKGEGADNIALIPSHGEPWTYRKLDAVASELALTLAGLGSRLNEAGGRVPMLVLRSEAMMVAIYGILRAGQAYVPLDPSWPDKRKTVVIEDVDASALVLGEGCAVPRDCPDLPIVKLSKDGRPHAMTNFVPACVQLPLPRPKPGDSVYIIYTSGTTGKPKGVDVPHLGLAGRTMWLQHNWPLNRTDTVPQKIPATFAMSEWELFWPLCNGARLALAADGLHGDPQHIAEIHEKHKVTHTIFVPSLLDQLVDELDTKALPLIRMIICCGEPLRSNTIRATRRSLPNAELVNVYGPTEASMTMLRIPKEPTQKDLLRFPIGIPIENTSVYVSWGEPPALDLSPMLSTGELSFGGPFVANGYWRLPELTQHKFVDNPYAPGRVYRTGDLARWRADGSLEFMGRADQQVKFNGVRIELGEIESTLADLPGVVSAAAFVAPPHLVAACVLAGGGSKELSAGKHQQLLEELRQRLPRHTVPTRLEILTSLPLTDRSKVDRRQLLEDFSSRQEKEKARAAAIALAALPEELSASEAKVEEIMREVLGATQQLPSGSSFQELGFSSLLLGKLTTRIRRTFALPGLPATAVYRYPNMRALAAQVDELTLGEVESNSGLAGAVVPRVEKWHGESATSFLSWACMILGILIQSVTSEFAFLPAYYILFDIYFNYSLPVLFMSFGPVLMLDAIITALASVALKWVILGRRSPGDYPIYGWYYWKWWLVGRVEHYVDEHVNTVFGDTVVYSFILRILGARVASGVRVNHAHVSDVDLITFGENVRVERDATLCPARLCGGMLQLRRIHLGDGCFVGTRSYVPGGTEVPADMELGPMASSDKAGPYHMFPRTVPASSPSLTLTLYQLCFGFPMLMIVEGCTQIVVIGFMLCWWNFLVMKFRRKIGNATDLLIQNYHSLNSSRRPGWGWGFIAGKRAGYTLQDKRNVLFPFVLSIPWIMTFVQGFAHFFFIALVKRVVIGKFEEGPVQGDWDIFRRWLLERLVTSASFAEFMELWVNTEVLSCWYRLLGAKVAPRVNMDFFSAVEYDLINVETDVVFGSSVLLAPTEHKFSRPIFLRKGACVLDHSCVMPGTIVPEGTLLGSFTVVPSGQELETMTVYTGCEQGTCVRLFQRQLLPGERIEGQRVVFDARLDEQQNVSDDADVLDVHLLRRPVSLPPAAVRQRELEAKALSRHRSDTWFVLFNLWCMLSAFVFAPLPDLVYWSTILIDFEVYDAWKDSDWGELCSVLLIGPLFLLVTGWMLVVMILLKWLLIGKWTAGERPYYSWFHFRWAALMTAFSSLDDVLAEIAGTWLSILFLRCMGAKVPGNRVCFFGFGFEYDLLHIGDCVCIGHDCDVTAHTVENMVMKMEEVRFEEGCSCLNGSVVMPGGQMEPWSTLIEHSQVLKGEVVPSGSFFGGLPAKLLRGYQQPGHDLQNGGQRELDVLEPLEEEEEGQQPLLGGSSFASRRYQAGSSDSVSRAIPDATNEDESEFTQYQTDNEAEGTNHFAESFQAKVRSWFRRSVGHARRLR